MAELRILPRGETGDSACCSSEAQAECCEPAEKDDCCSPGSTGCGCSAGPAEAAT